MGACGQKHPKIVWAAIKIRSLKINNDLIPISIKTFLSALRPQKKPVHYYLEVCPLIKSFPLLPSNHLKKPPTFPTQQGIVSPLHELLL